MNQLPMFPVQNTEGQCSYLKLDTLKLVNTILNVFKEKSYMCI